MVLIEFNFTSPQENVRIGPFMTPEEDFAIEFSLDDSKYNTYFGPSVSTSGIKGNQPVSGNVTLTPTNFTYNLHNGLNHLMINSVWFHALYRPKNQPGHLQLVSRVGAGVLMPHAENVIDGNHNNVDPKDVNVCCTARNDWWQINGWTAGAEFGFRYTVTSPSTSN